MNITVIAVGKLKEHFWVDACGEYAKRLKAYATFDVLEISDCDPKRCGGVEGAVGKEALGIQKALPASSHIVLLSSTGKQRTSVALAAHLEQLFLAGKSHLTFIIGGSHGVSRDIEQMVDEEISFGLITLPHNLARVVLLEQLYRVFKILRHEPYHK